MKNKLIWFFSLSFGIILFGFTVIFLFPKTELTNDYLLKQLFGLMIIGFVTGLLGTYTGPKFVQVIKEGKRQRMEQHRNL